MSLIVEDGSIVTGAESYASVAAADAYFAARNEPAAWTGASDPEKEEIPTELLRATIEAAAKQAASDLAADVDASAAGIAKESVKVGPVTESIEYVGGKMTEVVYTKIERLIAELIKPAGQIVRA